MSLVSRRASGTGCSGRVNATVDTFTTLMTLFGADRSVASSPRSGGLRAAFCGRPPRRGPVARGRLVLAGPPHPGRAARGRPSACPATGCRSPNDTGRARRRRPLVPAHPRNTLNELSGEEWLYFTKSVWTTAYPSELGHALRRAARREQAAAADGPADRVLHQARRAGARPVRRRRRDAPRRGDRARRRGGRSGSSWRRAGRTVYARVVARGSRRARDGAGPELADLGAERPGRPADLRPVGLRAAGRRRARSSSRRSPPSRSTSSRPIRRTTSSCR